MCFSFFRQQNKNSPSKTTGSEKISILVAGASGKMGSLIVKYALERPELLVNILVRDPTKHQQLTKAVEKAGGKVFKGGVTEPEILAQATKNIHTVISATFAFEESVTVDGQINLLNASIKNGVRRFVPSDFGVNYTNFTREELGRTAIVAPKIKFSDYLEKPSVKSSIKTLHFYQGSIIETFFELMAHGFGYWGEDNFKLNFTSYDNIARAVAAGVARPNLTGTIVFIGESLSYKEVAEVYNKVRGTNIQPKQNGPVEVLKGIYEDNRKRGEFLAEIFGLSLLLSDKRCTFEKNDNSVLPEVKAFSFAEFLKLNPNLKLA